MQSKCDETAALVPRQNTQVENDIQTCFGSVESRPFRPAMVQVWSIAQKMAQTHSVTHESRSRHSKSGSLDNPKDEFSVILENWPHSRVIQRIAKKTDSEQLNQNRLSLAQILESETNKACEGSSKEKEKGCQRQDQRQNEEVGEEGSHIEDCRSVNVADAIRQNQ